MDKTIFFVLWTISSALCQDVCTPGDDSTCPVGHCCVKKGLAYLPEYTGPRPPFRISCKRFKQRGEWCYPKPGLAGMCPCASGLTCGNVQILGRCE